MRDEYPVTRSTVLAESMGRSLLAEWHEDDGAVVWWRFLVDEPAWIGTPLDDDWPGYHTHWTPHPAAPTLPVETTR